MGRLALVLKILLMKDLLWVTGLNSVVSKVS
jgi:hypothetical protein